MNLRLFLVNSIIKFLLSVGLLLVGAFLIYISFEKALWLRVIITIIGLIMGVMGFMVSKGLPNKTSVSKTSCLYTVLEIAKDTHKNVAYVFLDYGSYSQVGFRELIKTYEKIADKKVIYLNSISLGDILVARTGCENAKFNQLDKAIIVEYEGATYEKLNDFMMISTVHKDNGDLYYVPNCLTENDLSIDMQKMGEIEQFIKSYIIANT